MPAFNLNGAPNFRDLGGYAGGGGRRVRHHRLFRSDHLGHLAPEDLSALASNVGQAVRVLDLRGETERLPTPCAIPGATVHSLPIEPTIVQKLSGILSAGQTPGRAETVALMQDTYRNFVRGNTPRFAALFAHVLDPQDAPLVFHCTAGKDRTGLAAALLLLALDVPGEVVMQDYLLTNARLQGRTPEWPVPAEVREILWGVQEDFLRAAFEAIDEDYGGLKHYFRAGLGIGEPEKARLAQLYLL